MENITSLDVIAICDHRAEIRKGRKMFDQDGMWRFQIELSAGQRLIVQEIEMRCEIDRGTNDYDPDTFEVRDLKTDRWVSLKTLIQKSHTRCRWMYDAARYQLQSERDEFRAVLADWACGDYEERKWHETP